MFESKINTEMLQGVDLLAQSGRSIEVGEVNS